MFEFSVYLVVLSEASFDVVCKPGWLRWTECFFFVWNEIATIFKIVLLSRRTWRFGFIIFLKAGEPTKIAEKPLVTPLSELVRNDKSYE